MEKADHEFLGLLKAADPWLMRLAVMNGELIHRDCGMAFYKYNGQIFVVEADRPVGLPSDDA